MAHTYTLQTTTLTVPPSRLPQLFEMIGLWHTRARTRRQLLSLEDHRLDDLGLTRKECLAEARKPFWKS